MRVIQYGSHLWQLTRWGAFNCYLVREADGLTLIDSIMSGSGKGILQAAQKIGLSIVRVTLTHAHMDHAGSLDEVCAQLPNSEVAFSARTAEFLRGNRELRPDEPQRKLRGSYVVRSTPATRIIQPGDRLGSLRVVTAPGHTPDHIAFYDERDGTLIAGDAFQTQGGPAVSGVVRWSFPFPALANWDFPTAVATAISLHALNPTTLAVGHGRVLENPMAVMDEAIREAEEKL